MKTERLMILVTWFLLGDCAAHVVNNKQTELTAMLQKMDEITKHLRHLMAAMADFDIELKGLLSVDSTHPAPSRRSTEEDEDSVSCRLSLREDLCQALEIMKAREQASYLVSPESPGKRSGKDVSSKYRKIVSDLTRKRDLLLALKKIFKNAGNILEREKKWFACNLNLGFTCQTQDVSEITDYYDYLKSLESPGKKRSASVMVKNF